MNFDKTKCVWFGCEQAPNVRYMPTFDFDWNPETFRMLGVDFTVNLQDISDININKKITEITKEINNWSRRHLTPLGKIVVLKTLILSKIVHLLISLPPPSEKVMKELNSIFYKFLWNGGPDKVKRTIITQKLENGGLGMIDLKSFEQSLKITWIKRLFMSEAKWKTLIVARHPQLKDIHKFGNEFPRIIANNVKNPFWESVLKYFAQFTKIYYCNHKNEIDSYSFIFNEDIKIGKSCIKYKSFIDNDIHYIYQLRDGETFLSHNDFTTKYNIDINFLVYNSVISAVKEYCSKFPKQKIIKRLQPQLHLKLILNTIKGTSPLYQELIKDNTNKTVQSKWQNIIGITLIEWKSSFPLLKYTTADTKLLWLQFRILHSILTTNRSVSKFNMEQSDICEFCKAHSETIHHLVWECPIVNAFGKELNELINHRCSLNFTINECMAIVGHDIHFETDKIFGFIILLAKQYIYKCKVQKGKLNIRHFIRHLYSRYCVEKLIAINSQELQTAWEPYLRMFQALL